MEEDINIDTITKRPRTPNDQYTLLTDEQIRNIKQSSSPFFQTQSSNVNSGVYTPKEGGRFYRDWYTAVTSQHLTRVPNAQHAFGWINEKYSRFPPELHDTCKERASVRWGKNKAGERTRSHYFGENPERYTTIDMYRRNATNYPGRVVMDCGRPADGYYTQKFPSNTTWFGSNAPLNRTVIMESVYKKTMEEYNEIKRAEKLARTARIGEWPEYSEYTDKYLLNTGTEKKLDPLEEKKRYSQSASPKTKNKLNEDDNVSTCKTPSDPGVSLNQRPLSAVH